MGKRLTAMTVAQHEVGLCFYPARKGASAPAAAT